jgi:hypothetical protein
MTFTSGYKLYRVVTTKAAFPYEAPNEDEARGQAEQELDFGEKILRVEYIADMAD